MILLGVGGYFGTGRQSVTALIPVLFGAPFLLLGLLALKETLRMHAMHVASLLGLIGALGRPVRKLLAGAARFNQSDRSP